MFASNLGDFLNGFIFNRNTWLIADDNTHLGKGNCKQGFDFSAKTRQSSKIDCSNNVTSNEKKIELDSSYLPNLRVKNMNRTVSFAISFRNERKTYCQETYLIEESK